MTDHAAGYDFVKLGKGLADTLMRAAEEQVTKAQTMMDQTKALVEIILNQVNAQAKASEDMNARFKEVGGIMLDAHRILNGDRSSTSATAPPLDLDKLRALDALRHNRLDAAKLDALGAKHAPTLHRAYSQDFAQQVRDFQRPLAASERPAASVDRSKDRDDQTF